MNAAHMHFPEISLAMIAAELAREDQLRRRFYPGRVETLRMSQADADHELAAIAALRQDVARLEACWFTPNRLAPPSHSCSWIDRRAAIAREIDLRRRVYPRHIEDGKLLEDDARHRIACLEALAAIYDDGLDWQASNGQRPAFHLVAGITPETERARREWASHSQRVSTLRNPATQGEMAI